jgi:hypothetical protein
VTLTILCAGALALPGGSDESARAALLAEYAPSATGPAARLFSRTRAPRSERDDALVPPELPDERWLREQFEPGEGDAIAAFAAPCAELPCLVVRPVHLDVGLDHLVLGVPPPGAVETAEAEALAETANALFAEDGLRWSVDAAHLWTLRAESTAGRARLASISTLRCHSARQAAGRNIDAWQPEGDAARVWRAIVSELQMLWYDHPVNRTREQHGQATLNSVWLEGQAGRAQRRAFDAVVSADEATAGLALSAGCEVSALAAGAPPADVSRLVAIQESARTMLVDPGWWRLAVSNADPDAWREGWAHLDSLIERLAGAGQALGRVVLTGERDLLEFSPQPADRWALWRRRGLLELLSTSR